MVQCCKENNNTNTCTRALYSHIDRYPKSRRKILPEIQRTKKECYVQFDGFHSFNFHQIDCPRILLLNIKPLNSSKQSTAVRSNCRHTTPTKKKYNMYIFERRTRMNKESKRVIIHVNFGADTTYGRIQTDSQSHLMPFGGARLSLSMPMHVWVCLCLIQFCMDSSEFSFFFLYASDIFNSTHGL